MEKFKRLHCIFPNLKRVELKMNLHNAIGTLQYIRDNRIDIFVNLDSLSNYNYWNVNINNFKIQENSIVHTTCKNKTSNNLIAYKVSVNGKFKFYSFDSGFFELWSYSMFNADGGYWIMTRIYEINLNNVKMLSDDENEEIKLDEYSNDFLYLKMYIENLNVVYNYPWLIFPNKNISKIGTNINQKYDESLVKAKKFEFFINENIINGFKSEGTLIEAVPDYISLGYDRSNTSFQSLGSQITLTIKISKITKKTLSIFWHLKNKNLQNLICYWQIPRSKSLCTKSEVTLLCIIRKLNTLKSLTLTLLDQNSKASSYIFKNLTPTRLQLIIDSVFGHDPSLPALEELSEPIDMRSLMLITDSISVIE